MAIINCKECKQGVSTKAKSCPNCGALVKKKSILGYAFLILILLFWVLGVLMIVVNIGTQRENSRQVSYSSNYKKIDRATSKQVAHCRCFLKKGYRCDNKGFTVKAKSFERIYFVAVKVYGPKYPNGIIGVWGHGGKKNNPGMAFSVNKAAVDYFSETGDIRNIRTVFPRERFPKAEALEKYARNNL